MKRDFFEVFIAYLTLEEASRITEAIALFMTQPLRAVQRLLWLADFFQIIDIQRFLISEVILPKLTASYALVFLGDATKKLRNPPHAGCMMDNELWEGFKEHIKRFIERNLQAVLHEEEAH